MSHRVMVLKRRIKKAAAMVLMVLTAPLQILALIIVRAIKPWLLVRIGWINSTRIGHMAANMELRLCAIDAGLCNPEGRHLDLWCCTQEYVCNEQLLKMWKRRVILLPRWSLTVLAHLNLRLKGGEAHHLDQYSDRDIHNLLDSSQPHLQFTKKELQFGQEQLTRIGVPKGAKFVCLVVRDSSYLNYMYSQSDWQYHNHRDSDIQSYVLAAEALAERGYYVLRMGAKVHAPINSKHPRVIDYAANGMRSDFMDIYLGATCEFCISTSTGFDAVPLIFRRPIVYVNMVPPGWLFTFSKRFLAITKHHYLISENRELTLREIFSNGVGFCTSNAEYQERNVRLVDNSPEEIRDVVLEMADRLAGTWVAQERDEELQQKFWAIFPTDAKWPNGVPYHGEIRSRYGAHFLRNSPSWVEGSTGN